MDNTRRIGLARRFLLNKTPSHSHSVVGAYIIFINLGIVTNSTVSPYSCQVTLDQLASYDFKLSQAILGDVTQGCHVVSVWRV